MLWSGLKALVRNAGVFALFLGADVGGQALLVWIVPIESASRVLWTSSLVLSLLWHVLCGCYLLFAAVRSGGQDGVRAGLRDVWVGTSTRLFPIAGTLVIVGTATVTGLVVFTWLGVAVLLALGLVPLAAAAGEPNPLRSGLAALARHALGYVWVVAVGVLVLALVSVAAGLVALYWPTPLAQVVAMTSEGVVVLWLACSLAPTVVAGAGR